jgi:hypothetical protein
LPGLIFTAAGIAVSLLRAFGQRAFNITPPWKEFQAHGSHGVAAHRQASAYENRGLKNRLTDHGAMFEDGVTPIAYSKRTRAMR